MSSAGSAGSASASAAAKAGGRPQAVIEKGAFFQILDGGAEYILADMTKRGLQPRSRSPDEDAGVEADMGVIHGMDGTGHRVPIRWFFPKGLHGLDDVMAAARSLEEKYTRLREMTCPDGGGGG